MHRAPERMIESSQPTLAHEPPDKSDATPPSSPEVGTIGHQPLPGKLRPLTQIRPQEHPTCNTVYVAAVRPTGSCSRDIGGEMLENLGKRFQSDRLEALGVTTTGR